jgi:hypothetical protein
VPAPPVSVHVSNGGGRGDATQRNYLRARRVTGAATCCVAADVSTAAGVYRRHVVTPASREAPLFAAPEPKCPLEFFPELS